MDSHGEDGVRWKDTGSHSMAVKSPRDGAAGGLGSRAARGTRGQCFGSDYQGGQARLVFVSSTDHGRDSVLS